MRNLKLLFIAMLAITLGSCKKEPGNKHIISIIPQPQKIIQGNGVFKLNNNTKIFSSSEFLNAAEYLSGVISTDKKYAVTSTNETKNISGNNCIVFIKDNVTPKEGYELKISPEKVVVKSSSVKGAFYAVQTIRQLLPASIEKSTNNIKSNLTLPEVTISDFPRFKWRGLHLDVSRNFFDVKFIKKTIDNLALHKMNVLHWHLVDDQGWRIEIKKYPKLTEIASIRKETVIGRNSGKYDGKQYGPFFYTQEEVKDIIKYAEKRGITIVPEIEMPGHTQAVLAAYPEYGCTGKRTEVWTQWGVSQNVYCAGQEKTFAFLQDILDEVCNLFPSEYIHIGGDECPKVQWEKCPKCQKRIKDNKLKDEHELQSYFIKRIEKYLNSKNRRLVGWDEILEGGLAPNATVMAWRSAHEGVKSAKQHHDVIMSPTSHCYIDYYQSKYREYEPFAIGGFVPLKRVYSFEPVPHELNAEETKHILGAQINLWTEYVSTNEHAEYMIFPRLAAISEVNWSSKKDKNWNSFSQRLLHLFKRYNALNINYSKSAFLVDASVVVGNNSDKYLIKLESELPSGEIYYTTDGSKPSVKSNKYVNPFEINKTSTIKAASFTSGKKTGKTTSKEFVVHKATFKNVKLINKPHKNYTPSDNKILVDGCFGTTTYRSPEWTGMYGKDFIAEVDLGEKQNISKVSLGLMRHQVSHIILPESITVLTSEDGKKYSQIAQKRFDKPVRTNTTGITLKESLKFKKINTRYVKIVAKNIGKLPKWYNMPDNYSYLFVDEIEVW